MINKYQSLEKNIEKGDNGVGAIKLRILQRKIISYTVSNSNIIKSNMQYYTV